MSQTLNMTCSYLLFFLAHRHVLILLPSKLANKPLSLPSNFYQTKRETCVSFFSLICVLKRTSICFFLVEYPKQFSSTSIERPKVNYNLDEHKIKQPKLLKFSLSLQPLQQTLQFEEEQTRLPLQQEPAHS